MLGWLATGAALLLAPAGHAQDGPREQSILFVGNSFTFGAGSDVWHYRAETVEDLNGTGVGGVPALFKRFADQMGLPFRVSLETEGGQTLRFHYEERRARLDRAWDHVLLQDYSTLDPAKPGDGGQLKRFASRFADFFVERQPMVDVRLVATWSRPDLVYGQGNPWAGQPIEAMAEQVSEAYRAAAASDPRLGGVVPVGRAFNDAIASGLADRNPLDGIDPGRVDLWAADHYHASNVGYYLEALTIFGSVTGVDPQRLGPDEAAARDLGIPPYQAVELQRIAAAALAQAGRAPGSRADRKAPEPPNP